MFSIGAFSRLCQLSIRVLRHYDQIGLLVPARVNPENGYRFYTAEQLADAHRIVALKELGLGLEAIGTVLQEGPSVDLIAGMLRLEQLRADQQRREAERRLRDLTVRLEQLSNLGRMPDIELVEKVVPATPYYAHRASLPSLDAAYALMAQVVERCASFRGDAPLLAVAHDAFFDTENLDLEIGYPIQRSGDPSPHSPPAMVERLLPSEERMLSAVYVGSEEEGHRRAHHAMALWLERHGSELAGPGRELIHGSERGSEPHTIEIQYPVRAQRTTP